MFPSRPCRLSPCARLPASTAPARSEFAGGGKVLPSHTTRAVLYHTGHLGGHDPARSSGRNQQFPDSIGFLPLHQAHGSELHVSTPSGLPPAFPPASSCPGVDHPASGFRSVAGCRVTTAFLTPRLPTGEVRDTSRTEYPRQGIEAANIRFPYVTAAYAA